MSDPAAQPAPELMPLLWRHLTSPYPEAELAHRDAKRRFWRPHQTTWAGAHRERFMHVEPDALSAKIAARHEENPGKVIPMRAGDPTTEYRGGLEAHLESITPQFNLRNVNRVRMEGDPTYLEWGKTAVPSRGGWEDDLAEVRSARLEPVDFCTRDYSTVALCDLRDQWVQVFIKNDWEQWYGDDKKREAGTLWRFIPGDGGQRTREWPKLLIRPHIYWKGRLMPPGS